jgi:hypothetical protein
MVRRFVCLAAFTLLAALCLQMPGDARQFAPPASAANFDIRFEPGQAAAQYLGRVAAARSASAEAMALRARVDGLARLRRVYRSLEVRPSPALRTLEVIGTEPGTGFLTGPGSDRVATLRGFLSSFADAYAVSPAQVDALEVVSDYVNPSGNMAWVELQQRINGLPVFQGTIRGGFTRRGELARTTGTLATGIEASALATAPSLAAPQAIVMAAAGVGWEIDEARLLETGTDAAGHLMFAPAGMADVPRAWLLYFPLASGTARLAWAVQIIGDPFSFLVLLDAEDGTLLFRKNLTAFQSQLATYTIYNDDSPAPLSPSTVLPGSGTQAPPISRSTFVLVGNEPPNTFNTLGWIPDGGNTTEGNNVAAGIGVGGGGIEPTVGFSRTFDFPYNPAPGNPPPGEAPTLSDYQKGVVTNVFYWTNVYHDRLYRLGFTEAAGNFQQDTFGRGGAGGDRVVAATFSSGNNASFSTPFDGSPGQLRLMGFTGPDPDRPSGLDRETIVHELTHGTSNRLHGTTGLSQNMAKGMGEGWSDFYAHALLSTPDEDVNGVYADGPWLTYQLNNASFIDNYYYGIRRFPYAIKTSIGGQLGRPHNPLTFADIDATQADLSDGAFAPSPIGGGDADEVHNMGEVWALALFEVRARFIARLGWVTGNERVLQFITDGMKFDPANPTMIEGRDAIVAAAHAGGATAADIADIWAGFAVRGMGLSARVLHDGGSVGSNQTRVVEAFDVPTFRQAGATIASESIPNGFFDSGERVSLSICLTHEAMATTGVLTGTLLASGGISAPSAPQSFGELTLGANVCRTFTFVVDAACGGSVTASLEVQESGGATRVFTQPFAVGNRVPVFTENFDGIASPGLPTGWSTETLSGAANPWTTRDADAFLSPPSMPNQTFAYNLGVISDSVLMSPTVALSSRPHRLTFWNFHWMDASDGFYYDGGVLEISVNGGPFEDIMAAGGTFLGGGYNAILQNLYGNPIGGRQAWSAQSDGFILTAVDLPPAASGQPIALRWRIGSDNEFQYPGWALDDILIDELVCSVAPAPPTATSEAYSTPFNTPLSVPAPGVLGNDTGAGPLSAALVTPVAHGAVTLNADGSFTYTPAAGYSGPDAFTYTANNGGGPGNVATASLSVAAPTPPAAVDDAYATPFNTVLSVSAPGVLGNDTSTSPISAALVATVAHGALTLNADGSFTYAPTPDYSGPDTFTYSATNVSGASNVATARLTVAAPMSVQPPTDLRARSIADNTIILTWTPPSTGPVPTGFVVEGGIASGEVLASIPLGTAPGMALTAPTGAFYVRVHTLADGQRSAASNEIRVFVDTPTPPSPPADLLGVVNGSSGALSWRNTFDGGAPTSIVLDVTGTHTLTIPLALTDTATSAGIPPGTYTFSVRAVNAAGVSAPSPPVTLTFPGGCSGVPQAPANFVLAKLGNVAYLLWDLPSSGPAPTEYVLNVTGSFIGSIPLGTARTYSAVPGQGTYHLSVQALNACGPGAATSVQTITFP